jgi:hypothetical protein
MNQQYQGFLMLIKKEKNLWRGRTRIYIFHVREFKICKYEEKLYLEYEQPYTKPLGLGRLLKKEKVLK